MFLNNVIIGVNIERLRRIRPLRPVRRIPTIERIAKPNEKLMVLRQRRARNNRLRRVVIAKQNTAVIRTAEPATRIRRNATHAIAIVRGEVRDVLSLAMESRLLEGAVADLLHAVAARGEIEAGFVDGEVGEGAVHDGGASGVLVGAFAVPPRVLGVQVGDDVFVVAGDVDVGAASLELAAPGDGELGEGGLVGCGHGDGGGEAGEEEESGVHCGWVLSWVGSMSGRANWILGSLAGCRCDAKGWRDVIVVSKVYVVMLACSARYQRGALSVDACWCQ
jgi:hypothetical protein